MNANKRDTLILMGRVVKGEGMGKKLGYPTANLDRRFLNRHPVPDGVWACRVKVQSSKFKVQSFASWLKGIAIIGMDDKQRGGKKVEIYILDFDKNIYGWHLEAELVQKLRPLLKYKDEQRLIERIKKDIIVARQILYG